MHPAPRNRPPGSPQGYVSASSAVAWVHGANIGTCVSPVFTALGKGRAALRVALAYLLFKAVGVVILVSWPPATDLFSRAVAWSTAGPMLRAEEAALDAMLEASGGALGGGVASVDRIRLAAQRAIIPVRIAHAHTLLNVFVAVLFLPVLPCVARLMLALVPPELTAADRGAVAVPLWRRALAACCCFCCCIRLRRGGSEGGSGSEGTLGSLPPTDSFDADAGLGGADARWGAAPQRRKASPPRPRQWWGSLLGALFRRRPPAPARAAGFAREGGAGDAPPRSRADPRWRADSLDGLGEPGARRGGAAAASFLGEPGATRGRSRDRDRDRGSGPLRGAGAGGGAGALGASRSSHPRPSSPAADEEGDDDALAALVDGTRGAAGGGGSEEDFSEGEGLLTAAAAGERSARVGGGAHGGSGVGGILAALTGPRLGRGR